MSIYDDLAPDDVAVLPRDALEEEVRLLRAENLLVQRKLKGIQEIGQILATDRQIDRVLVEIIKRTTAIMGADRSTLYILQDDGETMLSKSTSGGQIQTIELKVGQGIAGWVAQHNRAVNVKDAYKDARFDPAVDRASGYRTESILCCPLQDMNGQSLGVIQVLNKQDGYFTTADEGLLRAIAGQAAVCIRNSRLYLDVVSKNIDLLDTQLKLEERTAEVELLFRVERAAALSMTQDQALSGALECVFGEYPSTAAAVLLYDEAQNALIVDRALGDGAPWLLGARVAVDGTLPGESMRDNEPRALRPSESSRADALGLPLPPELIVHNALCLPIHGPDGGLGCLLLLNRTRDPRAFDDRDVRILRMIASRMGLSITLARTIVEERKAERLAAIGQTLSGVVHDVKTPLTIIGGYARLLAKEDDPAVRQRHRELIKRQIDAVQAMIQELLEFARGESQALLRKVSVKDFFAELSELLEAEFAGSGIELVVDAPYRGAVRMDTAKMLRAVFNLARNAKEAMGEAGRFTVRAEERDGQVLLSFGDTGPGIPKEMEGRLFDSFATFGKKNGTGLGLAIVKKIVDEHHGTLSVSSEPGHGTTFTIALEP